MLKVDNLIVSVNDSEDALEKKIRKELRIRPEEEFSFSVYKRSIDARKKEDVRYVYSVIVEIKQEKKFLRNKNSTIFKEKIYEIPVVEEYLGSRPIIVGSGPGGLLTAYLLASAKLKPLIVERGKKVEERAKDVERFWEDGILNLESNALFGEGGSGTFSDGKLNTGKGDFRGRKVLELLNELGAPEEILIDSKPHIGTDNLRKVIKNMREKIESLGGEFAFSTKLLDYEDLDDKTVKVKLEKNGSHEFFITDKLILAIGHSSFDTLAMLYTNGIKLEAKDFSIGVRIEHLQSFINSTWYGDEVDIEKIGNASYKINMKTDEGIGVYSFCMCPGGQVVGATNLEGRIVTNGMSYSKRNLVNGNSGILVSIKAKEIIGDNPLKGVELQKEIEEKAFKIGGGSYKAPVQKVIDYIENKTSENLGEVIPSYKPGVTLANINECLPQNINNSLIKAFQFFEKKWPGFASKGIITGIETRSSSPVRIIRDEEYKSNNPSIYIVGEGGGYAGGIISAAIDGIKCGEKIINNLKNKK